MSNVFIIGTAGFIGFHLAQLLLSQEYQMRGFDVELRNYGVAVDVHDPWASADEVRGEYRIDLVVDPAEGNYDCIALATAHDYFREMRAEGARAFGAPGAVLYDLKYVFEADVIDLRL